MKNCYAVVRTDVHDTNALVSFHLTLTAAEAEVKGLRKLMVYTSNTPLAVMKVELSPVQENTEDRVERLENEVRTLRTLLTSLQGRVAELSKVSTPLRYSIFD
jgi:hypothetical protein